jgi:hypothetical protein
VQTDCLLNRDTMKCEGTCPMTGDACVFDFSVSGCRCGPHCESAQPPTCGGGCEFEDEFCQIISPPSGPPFCDCVPFD